MSEITTALVEGWADLGLDVRDARRAEIYPRARVWGIDGMEMGAGSCVRRDGSWRMEGED